MMIGLITELYALRDRARALGMTRTVVEIDGLIGALR